MELFGDYLSYKVYFKSVSFTIIIIYPILYFFYKYFFLLFILVFRLGIHFHPGHNTIFNYLIMGVVFSFYFFSGLINCKPFPTRPNYKSFISINVCFFKGLLMAALGLALDAVSSFYDT